MTAIRTRFAPSPTGYLHVGGARTALFSWLHARKHGGKFILRIEDTDLERSTAESVNAILEGMAWLGLEYDEGPFYQTQRFDRYAEVTQQLLDKGMAYRCNCSKERLETLREAQMQRKEKPRYDGHCRNKSVPADEPHVVRFRTPQEGAVVVDDQVRGKVVVNNAELDDLIIKRTDGAPTYNLSVVVDDAEMGITHVIRGDDHINNTPRQIHILKALGYEPPHYAHVPMILGDDGARLSKRHGAVGVMQYREEGYLPEALLNYLVRLGWSHGDQEIFSLDEMIALFDISKVNKSASAFNTDKLLWLNQHYIKESDSLHVAHHLSYHMGKLGIDPSAGPSLVEIIKVQGEKVKTLVELAEISVFFYRDPTEYPEKMAQKAFKDDSIAVLEKVKTALNNLQEWTSANLHSVIEGVVQDLGVGFGKVGAPVRLALTGGAPSPDIGITLYLVGKLASIRRLEHAIAYIMQNKP